MACHDSPRSNQMLLFWSYLPTCWKPKIYWISPRQKHGIGGGFYIEERWRKTVGEPLTAGFLVDSGFQSLFHSYGGLPTSKPFIPLLPGSTVKTGGIMAERKDYHCLDRCYCLFLHTRRYCWLRNRQEWLEQPIACHFWQLWTTISHH